MIGFSTAKGHACVSEDKFISRLSIGEFKPNLGRRDVRVAAYQNLVPAILKNAAVS